MNNGFIAYKKLMTSLFKKRVNGTENKAKQFHLLP